MTNIKNHRILILGGDERIEELVKLYYEEGYAISTYGHESMKDRIVKEYETLEEGIRNNDTIIGPIPFNTGAKINMKLSKKTVSVDAFINLMNKDKTLILGSPDSYFANLAQEMGIKYYDYNKDECFQISNAVSTAEGAISIIINERNTTIYGSNILILGYGRIGKILSNYLKIFNPNLYVSARRDTDITWINVNGYKKVEVDEIYSYISNVDIMINTVPAAIVSNDLIDKMSKDILIIDLASKPGGLDHNYAIRKGLKTIHALGLPGKVAPKSAAKVIFYTILKKA